MKDQFVIGSIARVMRGSNVSMEVKKSLRNSSLLLTLTYGSETWTWNRAQQSKMHAVEISYLRGARSVTRWEGESNENIYERCVMGTHANGVKCDVVEWVKKNTMRWFGQRKVKNF